MPNRGEVVDRVNVAHPQLLEGFSCTSVLTYMAQIKGVSLLNSSLRVQQAYALIREDINQANVQSSDLVAQAIHLVMESAHLGLTQNNPGAVDGAIAQLDKLCGLSPARHCVYWLIWVRKELIFSHSWVMEMMTHSVMV